MDLKEIGAQATGNLLERPKEAAQQIGSFALKFLGNTADVLLGTASRFVSFTPPHRELMKEDYARMRFRTKPTPEAEETPFDVTPEEAPNELLSRSD